MIRCCSVPAEGLAVPGAAGPSAVALHIKSRWDVYLLLGELAREAEVAGARLRGTFKLVGQCPFRVVGNDC